MLAAYNFENIAACKK